MWNKVSPHKTTEKSVNSKIYSSLLLATALTGAFAQQAAAHSGEASVTSIPAFEVTSNGSSYTQIASPKNGFYADVHVKINTGFGEGKIEFWRSYPLIHFDKSPLVGGGGTNYLELNSDKSPARTYSSPRPKDVDGNFKSKLYVPLDYADRMVKACNDLAKKLRGQGKSNNEIFATDRIVDLYVNSGLRYRRTLTAGADDGSSGLGQISKRNLTCKKWAGTTQNTAGALAGKMTINSVKFKIDPQFDPMTATCPVMVPLVATIKTTAKGVVKYRLRSAFGKISPIYTTTVSSKTAGAYQKTHIVQIKVPLAPSSGSGGSGGGVQTGATGMAAAPKKDDEIPPSGGGVKPGPSNKADKPTAGNVHKRSFRVETISPNKVVSNYDGYIITCKPKPNTAPIGGSKKQNKNSQSGQAAPSTKPAAGAKKVTSKKGKPDLMATTIGMSLAGGVHPWGSKVIVSNQQHAAKKGLGRNKDLCQLNNVRFRPFNKGTAASGSFNISLGVKAGNKTVYSKSVNIANLPPKSGLAANSGWLSSNTLVKQGWNKVLVKLDSSNKVKESNEKNNNYKLDVKIDFPCTAGRTKKIGKKKN